VSPRRAASLLRLLPLYLALATAIGFVDYHIRPHPDLGFTKYIPEVLAGTAEAPGRYRVLAPAAYQLLADLTGATPLIAWLVFRWLCLLAALLAGHLYLRTWFDDGAAAAGNACVFALLPLTFTNGWPNPDQFTELALFTFACACIARGWHAAFLVSLVLNAFNRETSIFLVMLFVLAAPLSRSRLIVGAAAAAIWLVIWAGLRWSLGFESYDMWQLSRNVERLIPLPANFPPYYRIYGWFFLILLVPSFILAAWRWRAQPRVARVAAAIVAPAYVIVAIMFSSVIESRIFTAVLPLLLPSIAFALFAPSTPEAV